MEAAVLRGETIHIRFFEPRYLKLAEDALLSDRRFVYLSTAAHEELDRKGNAVGTLMHITDHHDGATHRSCQCLAGPRIKVSTPGKEAVDDRYMTDYTKQMGSKLPLTCVDWEPHAEANTAGNQSEGLAEAVAVALICREIIVDRVQEGILATWIARCGVPPPLEERPEDFSLWLAACLIPSSRMNVATRQEMLEETAAGRLVRLYKALQQIPAR